VNLDYLWIGGANSLESEEAVREKVRFFPIHTLKLSTVWSPKVLIYPFVLLRGLFQARAVLLAEKPDIVFSKGGPGSLSVGIAAWMLMIPLWIHESDTIPGKSNLLLGVIAERVFLGFDISRKHFRDMKCTVV
jgi:UDP-N-acetylglucosamine--N-acetylmuramyl-(pentapeptide) pyrophosphoryl-undecaprenol N-acetylglucosamine transferase